jgi:hypothetical protein
MSGVTAGAILSAGCTSVWPSRSKRFADITRHRIEQGLRDPDGLEVARIDDDNGIDVIVANSTGTPAVYWYQQGEDQWQQHVVDNSTGFEKIEGVDAADFDDDGRTEIVTLDQLRGTVFISTVDNPKSESKSWSTAAIDETAPLVQCSLETDLTRNGYPDLLYAYEGWHGTAGGVAWLEYTTGDITDASNWRKHQVVQADGAWWIAQEQRDYSGNGRENDIVFSSRESGRSGHTGTGKITWMEVPSDPTDQWESHIIEDGEDYAPLHVTTGNFFNDGHEKDVAAGAFDRGRGIYLYSFSDGWQRTRLLTDHRFHNVRALDITSRNRHELYANTDDGVSMILQHTGSSWEVVAEFDLLKSDDRIIPVDINSDSALDVVTVAAISGTVDWWSFDVE